MVKHSMETGHPPVCMKEFHILIKVFDYYKFKRKVCQALLVKNNNQHYMLKSTQ